MKRVRVQKLAGQWLSMTAGRPHAAASVLQFSTSSPPATISSSVPSPGLPGRCRSVPRRCQSTIAAADSTAYRGVHNPTAAAAGAPAGGFSLHSSSSSSSSSPLLSSAAPNTAPGLGPSTDPRFPEIFPEAAALPAYPSPTPERARSSAKLAALHARLRLSQRLPLETLARALVDPSADASPRFNNASLAYLGSTLVNYHASEWLMCRYPRLPMVILYAAMKAYAGPQALADVARQWGVEAAAAPGAEVDPGLLQYSLVGERQVIRRWGYQRAEAKNLKRYKWRHGISSRVVLDDDFGDMVAEQEEGQGGGQTPPAGAADAAGAAGELGAGGLPSAVDLGGSMDAAAKTRIADDAHANFVRAVTGAVYAHGGREAVRAFVQAHVLSRQLDLERLFRFKLPTRELAYLCARENFEPPVARLEAETGRLSRTPVYVVGIYSGNDKLGEGAAASLDHARAKAAMNSLKAWYLYSPGDNVRVPSDMLVEGAAAWEPAYVDIGEIL